MKKLSVVFLACLMGASLAVAAGTQNAPRVIRVTMNDGTIHEFLVESVQNMTFDANQEDSSFVLPDTREPEPNLTEEEDNPYVKSRPATPKVDRKVAPVTVKTEQPVKVNFDADKQALEFFTGLTPSDFHYSAALAGMGDLCLRRKDFSVAAEYYETALSEIRFHMGVNNFHEIVSEHLEEAYRGMGTTAQEYHESL